MSDVSGARERRRVFGSAAFWSLAAALAALFCAAVLFVWSANDASFRMAEWQAKVSPGLQRVRTAPGAVDPLGIADQMGVVRWDSLGQRVIALYALYGLGIGSTAALVLLCAAHPQKRGIVACVAIFGAWVALFATRSAIDDWRLRRQVASLLPMFEEAASALHEEWPTDSGEIPPGIKFFVSEPHPDVLVLRGDRDPYPFREDFGLMISRGRNGVVRFDLAADPTSEVEFHPNGTGPSAHRSGFGNPSPPIASVHQLKENWYLARYSGW